VKPTRPVVRPLRAVLLLALAQASCRPLPREPVVSGVDIRGVSADDRVKLEAGISTAETPRLLGFIPRVLEYTTYDANVLARDLERIERYLRARGYYEAKVIAARVIKSGSHSVRVEIEVNQGLPVRVTRIDPGIGALPGDVMRAANLARHMAEDDVFDEAAFEDDRRRIERALRDSGYAFALVDAKVTVDVAAHSAHVVYHLDAGPRAVYGPITIVGLREIPEGPVRDNLSLEPGAVYSESELEDAERALVNLGVFTTVDIHPDRSQKASGVVPIQVNVRESALRALRIGGGAHFDVLRLFARLDTGWEHKNFLGGMRDFSIDARPGVTFFPTRIDHLVPWVRYLPENRVSAQLRQPSFLEGRTTGSLNVQYNVYPLLYRLPEGEAPESEPIIGYHEIKASARVERAFFAHHLEVVPGYNWQANIPIDYQGSRAADLALKTVRVSFPELITTLSFVDDSLRPRLGFSLSNSLQMAGHGLGGTVDDFRIAPEFKFYLPVEKGVFAGRVSTGFLLPSGYGRRAFNASSDEATQSDVVADQQKLLFRAFYSGGPNSNRGYPYRTVGPQGPIGFLLPTGVDCAGTAADDSRCIRPLGGLTLWEASLEARIPFAADSPLWAVVFVDASDLRREVGRIRLNTPHLSPGAGLRYMTPVGPIRLDVGWRVPGLQGEGRPGSPLFGFFPGAIHLAIGEAF
jgi:outer membrane protein assembly factor BamA